MHIETELIFTPSIGFSIPRRLEMAVALSGTRNQHFLERYIGCVVKERIFRLSRKWTWACAESSIFFK